MREIKFRVWDLGKRVFIPNDVYALLLTGDKAFGIMTRDWENYREGEYFYVNSQMLIEFTGLLDMNGKEIYEGDVLKYTYHRDRTGKDISEFTSVVEWDGDNDNWSGFQVSKKMKHEVVGNIYENPELI